MRAFDVEGVDLLHLHRALAALALLVGRVHVVDEEVIGEQSEGPLSRRVEFVHPRSVRAGRIAVDEDRIASVDAAEVGLSEGPLTLREV